MQLAIVVGEQTPESAMHAQLWLVVHAAGELAHEDVAVPPSTPLSCVLQICPVEHVCVPHVNVPV